MNETTQATATTQTDSLVQGYRHMLKAAVIAAVLLAAAAVRMLLADNTGATVFYACLTVVFVGLSGIANDRIRAHSADR